MNRSSSHFSEKDKSENNQETIAAISTPFGESGIGIVRLSGPLAESIYRRIFKPRRQSPRCDSHFFQYGEIIDPGKGCPIDEVLVVMMRAPNSYTREDVLEIHCHGGFLIVRKVLDLVRRHGARLAEPGEFTKRAFLNGRIDLTQAEAVVDLINAKTSAGLEIANRQLRGVLWREVMKLKEELVEKLALVEAHIDFPDEEIDSISLNGMRNELEEMIGVIKGWIATYDEGKILRDGVSCAIVGKTNVGKSSLLNVLLKEDRAIVTAVPGTTRDVIEEVVNIREIPVRLMDTAGLRNTVDCVEIEGVRRTKEQVKIADLILLVLDGSRELDGEDQEIFDEAMDKRKVIVINKTDLPRKFSVEDIKSRFRTNPIVFVSALMKEGIDDLRNAIHGVMITGDVKTIAKSVIVANLRHKIALEKAEKGLLASRNGLVDEVSLEFIAFEMRSALEAFGEIVGETTTDEVLGRIFERFCIGK